MLYTIIVITPIIVLFILATWTNDFITRSGGSGGEGSKTKQ